MYLGSLLEQGTSGEIYKHPRHPYTKALFSAVPVPNPRIERNRRQILLSGDIPSPINAPEGCKFSNRCPLVKSRCSREAPDLQEIEPNHWIACHEKNLL
jgi:oligopeptide/dipeptide ABC transporter ATP-binding protein